MSAPINLDLSTPTLTLAKPLYKTKAYENLNLNKEIILNTEISLLKKQIIEDYSLNRKDNFWSSLTKSTAIYSGKLNENSFFVEKNDTFGNFEEIDNFLNYSKIYGKFEKIKNDKTLILLSVKLNDSIRRTFLVSIIVNLCFIYSGLYTIVLIIILIMILSYFHIKSSMKIGFEKFIKNLKNE